jgi:hypothetical protein
MRVIAGALLFVAAAILAGASILAEATVQSQGGLGNHATMGYLLAAALAVLGFLMAIGELVESEGHRLPRHLRHLMHGRHDQ